MNVNRPARYLILEEKPNPSTDYFVLSHVQARMSARQTERAISHGSGTKESQQQTDQQNHQRAPDVSSTSDALSAPSAPATPIHRFSWGQTIDPKLLDNACVILVRYVTSDFKALIDANRHKLNELVYFFDDDIPDTAASRGLSLKYRFKLYRYGARHFAWLGKTQASLWVSTPYLQDKYREHQPELLEPQQLTLPTDRCRVFYHATASHADEIAWLLPVMKAVLEKAPHVDFEIVGDAKTLALYRKLPRTTVVHPMSWQAYQNFVAWPGRHIGLAPFLPSAFNAARSYTKLFDIERAGARGILADTGPWATLPQVAGHTLLPMDPARWVAEIVAMSQKIAALAQQAATEQAMQRSTQ